ncbi:MAG: CoA pyrophosphatase [Firmicutes bacterium]|nr:CoA pyrophosphatase [Bacillota bacterium]
MKKTDIFDIREMFSGHEPRPMGRYRFYSVLVPFVEKDGELFLLFEKRTDDLDANPGEICFPGGRMEPGESPEECAVRECGEELGIPPSGITLIGRGDELRSFAGFTIHTVIAQVSYFAYQNIEPSPAEVKEAFLLPLSYFLENRPEIFMIPVSTDASGFPLEKIGARDSYNWFRGEYPVPVYGVEIPGGGVLWGMTARMLDNVSEYINAYMETKANGTDR